MRVKLKQFEGQRMTVKGTIYDMRPSKRNRNIQCILLYNLKNHNFSDEFLTDHVWIRVGKRMLQHEKIICRGDIIKFDARVKAYKKGNNIDYGLSYVSNVVTYGQNPKLKRIVFLENEPISYYKEETEDDL